MPIITPFISNAGIWTRIAIDVASNLAGPTPTTDTKKPNNDKTPAKPGDNKSNTQTTISENKYIPYNSNLRNDGPAQDGTGCWMA